MIKRADKGGATVICSTKWYEDEAYRQLKDTTFYKEVPTDKTKMHELVIVENLKKFVDQELIDTRTAKKLTPVESRTPEFYLMPKIHKNPITGRPVISSTGCATEKISAYVDQYLQPAAQELPSYIKDSSDFLEKIKRLKQVGARDYLVTLDVSSLYTNIDNEEGLNSIKQNPTIIKNNTSSVINMICILMSLILELNNFIFNGQHFQQTKGTAMGTRAAPNYASVFMGWFEDKFIYKSKWKEHIRYYGRYIDDVILVWSGTESDLQKFIEYINQVHSTIKFTYEYSTKEIHFLDITLKKDVHGNLSTDIYQKSTDTHSYLQRNSAHPIHCLKSIPYAQFLRLSRIISDEKKLKQRISEYIEYFVCSGYSRKVLKKTARQVVMAENKKQPVNQRINQANQLRFITTYNQKIQKVPELIKKHWQIVQTNEKCRDALKEVPQVAYKRGTNLADLLVRSKYRNGTTLGNKKKVGKVSRCGRCSWCTKVTEGSTFRSQTTGKQYVVLHNLKCTSPWVIYLSQCQIHKQQYVGKSETGLNIRFNNNRNHLKLPNPSCKLVQHFKNSTTCQFERDLTMMPIEQLNMAFDNQRTEEEKKATLKKREVFWQNELKTFVPEGMNKREG